MFDIAELKKAYRYYSTYAFLLVAGIPELVSLIMNSGLIEQPATVRYMQITAIVGLVLRYVKQKGDEAKAQSAAESLEYPPDDSGR